MFINSKMHCPKCGYEIKATTEYKGENENTTAMSCPECSFPFDLVTKVQITQYMQVKMEMGEVINWYGKPFGHSPKLQGDEQPDCGCTNTSQANKGGINA